MLRDNYLKNIGLAWVILGLVSSQSPGGSVEDACNTDRYSRLCLSGLLLAHCSRITWNLRSLGRCTDATRDLIQIFDMRVTAVEDGHAEVVVFEGEFGFLLNQVFTHQFLSELRTKLEQGLRHHTRFNLWNFTLGKVGGDTSKALWLLGVLLQDTSGDKAHWTEWNKKSDLSRLVQANLRLLYEVLDMLEPSTLEEENYQEWLRLYPSEVPSGVFSAKIYHYYTIAYLSMRLNWITRYRPMGRILPFLLEMSYKLRQIHPNSWIGAPRPFDRAEFDLQLRDIYTALVGTHWGTRQRLQELPSFRDFSRDFAQSPSQWVRRFAQF